MKKLLLSLWFFSSYSLYSLSFDNQLNYKLYTKASIINDQELLEKWFETSPYGLNFKIKKLNRDP